MNPIESIPTLLKWMLAGGLAALVLQGCSHSPGHDTQAMMEVWNQPDWPPDTMPAPPGFRVGPAAAYAAAARTGRLSAKHAWFCYRDEEAYYIADAFGRPATAANARRHGVRVDGQTGQVR